MRHRKPRTSFIMPLIGVALGVAGCDTTPGTAAMAPDPGAPDTLAPIETTTDASWDGSADGAALAAQAQRDVDALHEMRRRAMSDAKPAAAPATGAAPPETKTTAATTPPPGRIQWHEPPRVRTSPGAITAATTPTGPGPLARDPAPPLEVKPVAVPPAASANVIAVDDMRVDLVRLRQKLYRASIDSDQPIRELIAIAAMSLVDPQLELPDGADRQLTDTEQEVLRDLHAFFVRLGGSLDGSARADEAIALAVNDLQKSLVPESSLGLPTARLCWRVGGFGDFEPFDRTAFLAHAEQQFILYLEIDGFTSRANERGQWVTEVSQRLEIYSDRDGIPVWSESWQKAVDVTANQRRDFFTTQLITLPKALSVGRYQLKIQVRDEASGAESEESIAFEMVADPKMAASVPR
ncbi:MAG: hypothetical protein GY715_07930 [Planctomycetes bacterium]|nr:hypothetical protein [Planctomycetota bacterium]